MSLRRQGHDPTSADCGSLDVLSSANCSRGRASSGRKLTESPAHSGANLYQPVKGCLPACCLALLMVAYLESCPPGDAGLLTATSV